MASVTDTLAVSRLFHHIDEVRCGLPAGWCIYGQIVHALNGEADVVISAHFVAAAQAHSERWEYRGPVGEFRAWLDSKVRPN